MIVLKAQTAPWVAFFELAEKDLSPVPAQQSASAWKCIDVYSLPILFG